MSLLAVSWEAMHPDGRLELSLRNTSSHDAHGCSIIYSLRSSHPQYFAVSTPGSPAAEDIPDGILLPGERRLVRLEPIAPDALLWEHSLTTQDCSQSINLTQTGATVSSEHAALAPSGSDSSITEPRPRETLIYTPPSSKSPSGRERSPSPGHCYAPCASDKDASLTHLVESVRGSSLSRSVGGQRPFFVVYYERLGDEGRCLDAAYTWLASERRKYRAWREKTSSLRRRPLPPVLGAPVRWLSEAEAQRRGGAGEAVHTRRKAYSRSSAKMFRPARRGAGFVMVPCRRRLGAAVWSSADAAVDRLLPELRGQTGGNGSDSLGVSRNSEADTAEDSPLVDGAVCRQGQGLALFAVSESLRRHKRQQAETRGAPNANDASRSDEGPSFSMDEPSPRTFAFPAAPAHARTATDASVQMLEQTIPGDRTRRSSPDPAPLPSAETSPVAVEESHISLRRSIIGELVGSFIGQGWLPHLETGSGKGAAETDAARGKANPIESPRTGEMSQTQTEMQSQSQSQSQLLRVQQRQVPPSAASPVLSQKVARRLSLRQSGSPRAQHPPEVPQGRAFANTRDWPMAHVGDTIRRIFVHSAPLMQTAMDGTVSTVASSAQLIAGVIEDSIDILHTVGMPTLLLVSAGLLWLSFGATNDDAVGSTLDLFE